MVAAVYVAIKRQSRIVVIAAVFYEILYVCIAVHPAGRGRHRLDALNTGQVVALAVTVVVELRPACGEVRDLVVVVKTRHIDTDVRYTCGTANRIVRVAFAVITVGSIA